MTIVKAKRIETITWVLLVCILLDGFACSLNHGSHQGLLLALGETSFCITDASSAGDQVLAADVHELARQSLDCPLCGSVFLGIMVVLALGWLKRSAALPPLRPAPDPRRPRRHWPALNPHAP